MFITLCLLLSAYYSLLITLCLLPRMSETMGRIATFIVAIIGAIIQGSTVVHVCGRVTNLPVQCDSCVNLGISCR